VTTTVDVITAFVTFLVVGAAVGWLLIAFRQ
jgi:hypothetical protein